MRLKYKRSHEVQLQCTVEFQFSRTLLIFEMENISINNELPVAVRNSVNVLRRLGTWDLNTKQICVNNVATDGMAKNTMRGQKNKWFLHASNESRKLIWNIFCRMSIFFYYIRRKNIRESLVANRKLERKIVNMTTKRLMIVLLGHLTESVREFILYSRPCW